MIGKKKGFAEVFRMSFFFVIRVFFIFGKCVKTFILFILYYGKAYLSHVSHRFSFGLQCFEVTMIYFR